MKMNESMIVAEFRHGRKSARKAWIAYSDAQFINIARADYLQFRHALDGSVIIETFDAARRWLAEQYECRIEIIRESDFAENDEYLLDPQIFECAEKLEWV